MRNAYAIDMYINDDNDLPHRSVCNLCVWLALYMALVALRTHVVVAEFNLFGFAGDATEAKPIISLKIICAKFGIRLIIGNIVPCQWPGQRSFLVKTHVS